MFHRIKTAVAVVAAAGMAVGVMAQVPMQTTQDGVDGDRLVINGKKVFISGMNIAWHQFGSDLKDASTIDEFAFTQYIQSVRKHGGNAVRWWLHNDATFCPKISSTGEVTGLAAKSIESMRKVLDIAYENGVVVAMCLFSHNMLKNNGAGDWSEFSIDNNYAFLTSAANMDTYIENGLKPILAAVGNHPAVMCWEVFNEPEGMTAEYGSGWGMAKTMPYNDVITFTAKVAVAVHENTKKMVSTGIHEFNKTDYFPKYTDANLKVAAGGNEKAYLDFFMAHWYPEHQGVTTKSPFANNAASWGLDRPIIIGEFPGRDWGPGTRYTAYQQAAGAMTMVEAYKYAYENGYAGALSWAMTDEKCGSIEETAPGLKYLFDNYKSDILIKDVNIEDLVGDLSMKVKFTGMPVLTADQLELQFNKDMNFSGKTNVTFEIFIPEGSAVNLDLNVAVKTGTGWTWNSGSSFKLAALEQGKWVTVTAPVSEFANQAVLSNVKQITFQFGATGAPYTGTIFFDNVKLDNEVISDFDDQKLWGMYVNTVALEGTVALDVVTRAGVSTSVRYGGKVAGKAGLMPVVSVKGKTLSVKGINNSEMSVRMMDMRGKTIARFKATGSGQFSLSKIPAGRYVVETRAAGKRIGSAAVIVK